MSLDARLLSMLVCPVCKGPLKAGQHAGQQELVCPADHLAFAVRDGIAIMLEAEARPLTHADEPA
ncbi:MAG: Trm112 family protein [Proteobacteria bacterium]|nr:Trm112 family protein [Pseudomonadota bacterium]